MIERTTVVTVKADTKAEYEAIKAQVFAEAKDGWVLVENDLAKTIVATSVVAIDEKGNQL